MLLAFLSSLTEGNFVNNVNGLQFIDIMRIITAAAIIFPVFFFKKRQFDSKVVVNIFLVSPIIWLFMVIVDDVQLEDLFRDGSIFFTFLIIVSLPLLIVNIGEIKEFLKESYKKYKIDDLNE